MTSAKRSWRYSIIILSVVLLIALGVGLFYGSPAATNVSAETKAAIQQKLVEFTKSRARTADLFELIDIRIDGPTTSQPFFKATMNYKDSNEKYEVVSKHVSVHTDRNGQIIKFLNMSER